MPVRLQILFDVDLPTSVEETLDLKYGGSPDLTKMFISGHQLCRENPTIIPWMVTGGHRQFDFILTASPDKEPVLETEAPDYSG
jgi:hypothetical protein